MTNMRTLSTKIFLLVLITTFLAIIALWQYPVARLTLILLLLLFSVLQAFASVLAKHRQMYLQGRISSAVLVRNIAVEMTTLLLVMLLAGWLGHSLAQFATQQISNELVKLIAGILLGLLVGIGIGFLMRQIWKVFWKPRSHPEQISAGIS